MVCRHIALTDFEKGHVYDRDCVYAASDEFDDKLGAARAGDWVILFKKRKGGKIYITREAQLASIIFFTDSAGNRRWKFKDNKGAIEGIERR